MEARYDAVLFDLLTALLDSWTLWNEVAGDPATGREWRRRYLERTYATGEYRPYEEIIAEAAGDVSLPESAAADLVARWEEIEPWPEAPEVLRSLAEGGVPIGIVTNASEELAGRAVPLTGGDFSVVVTAEKAGYYKPHERPYALGVEGLDARSSRVLYVAGSPGDVAGASEAGMPVFWHDRVGLRKERPPPRTVLVHSTLHPLVEKVF